MYNTDLVIHYLITYFDITVILADSNTEYTTYLYKLSMGIHCYVSITTNSQVA